MFDPVKMRLGAFLHLSRSYLLRNCVLTQCGQGLIDELMIGSPSRVKSRLFDMGKGYTRRQNFDPGLNASQIVGLFENAKGL